MIAGKPFRTFAALALILAVFVNYTAPARLARAAGPNLPGKSVASTAALACDRPVRVMPLGDSITRGSASGTPVDPQYYISYRRDLYQSLAAKGYQVNFVGSQRNDGSYYADFDRDHEGWGGKRDEFIAANIYTWLTQNPADIVLLHIGTNDMSGDFPDTSPAGVERILNEIDRFDPGIWVIVARIIDRVPHDPDTAAYNSNVDAMLTARINASDKILKVDMETGAGIVYDLYPAGDMNDDKHPYATGYAKMAVKWEQALINLLPFCARDDSVTILEDSGSTIHALANDGGTNLSIAGWQSNPYTIHGSLIITPDGQDFKYTPSKDFFGEDSFVYRISDGPAGSVTAAQVIVTVTPVNDPPVANPDRMYTMVDQVLTFNSSELLNNDFPGPENESDQTLAVTAVRPGPGNHGEVTLNDGQIAYEPEAGFHGMASIEYEVCDEGLNGNTPNSSCSLGTVQVTVGTSEFFLPLLFKRSTFGRG